MKVMYKGQAVTGAPDESAFTSSDTSLTPASTDSIGLLASSDAGSDRWAKVSKNLKNTRYLVNKMGNTDISEVGDGTVTGAILYLSENGGGGTSIKLAEVSGSSLTANLRSVTIKWTDPTDVEISGVTLAAWAGTKVVRKEGSAPQTWKDGQVVVDSKTRNQYSSSGFTDNNLTYGTTYYYGFFPYTDGNVYTDSNDATKSVTPSKGTAATPVQTGTLTYTGSEQTPTWNYESAKMTKTETAQIDAGTYSTTFTLTDDYKWSDGTSEATKTISWTINRKSIEVPTQSNTLTYNGNQQSPTWSHSEGYTLETGSGKSYSTDAGTFSPIATLSSNYKWSDESTSTKTLSWSISRKTEAITVSSATVTLNTSNKTATVTVSNDNGRTLSVSSDATNVATASISGSTVTISHVNQTSGTATITVSAAQSTNYNASTATIEVTAAFIDTVLNNNDWATIQSVAQAGTGSNYWSVGDRKAVAISGTVGTLNMSGTYYAYILGFNHNQSKEGTAIHFQFGFDALSGGNHIAFCDSSYNSYNSSQCFNMNPAADSSSSSNVGGWSSSKMRTVLIPQFKNALPAALRSVLKAVTKYTDNTGNSSNVAANVTTTSDEIFLLAEYEVFGARTYANQYEYTDGKQAQYSYYVNGNDKIMKKHSDTNTAVVWWERSAYCDNAKRFCFVRASGSADYSSSGSSRGFAPGFAVG